jgi:hypothetical protein
MTARLSRADEERIGAECVRMLREALAPLREAQRAPLPPAPSLEDRAIAAAAPPAVRSRVDRLLLGAGYTAGDLARVDESNDDAPADVVARARAPRRGKR